MALNCAEIDLILSELSPKGCFIQKIRQPDFESLLLDLYRPGKDRFRIGIYLGNGKTRIQPETGPLPPPKTGLQRFAQLLRSRTDGARIDECVQIGHNRIIRFKLTRGSVITELYIRLWTGSANIFAVDENGIIIDAFFRRPGKNEVSGAPLILPEENKNTDRFVPRTLEGSGSFGEKIALLYADNGTEALSPCENNPYETLAAPLLAREAQIERLLKKFTAESESAESGEKEKMTADLLLSVPPLPPGSESVTVENFYDERRPLTIPLNPKLSLRENAEALYKQYRKKKAAAAILLSRIEELKTELARIKDQIIRLQGSDREETAQLLIRKQKQQTKNGKSLPSGFLRFESGNFVILVGRNGRENDTLLRSYVKGNDLWFHTRDVPGGYVFVKMGKKENIPEETFRDAAQLALWFSKAKHHGNADLYCTHVKYLRRVKDGPAGLVLPFHEKNIFVKEDKERLKRLLGKDFY